MSCRFTNATICSGSPGAAFEPGSRDLDAPGRSSVFQRKAGGPPWSALAAASSSAKKFGTWCSAS